MGPLRSLSSTPSSPTWASTSFADVRAWPSDASIGHIVLRDVSALPSVEQIDDLATSTLAADPSISRVRTSALFPGARERFADAGFEVCDRLALLERAIDRIEPLRTLRRSDDGAGRVVRLRRLGARRIDDAARIDTAAFPSGWTNTAASLADIAHATPRHRARIALDGDRPVGFSITGVAGPVGYLQRLAVDPADQGRGVGRRLVDDALGWLQRRGATTVLVNTGIDNEPALALYRSFGFHRRRDELVVMERTR